MCGAWVLSEHVKFSFVHDMLVGTKRASERTNEIGTRVVVTDALA